MIEKRGYRNGEGKRRGGIGVRGLSIKKKTLSFNSSPCDPGLPSLNHASVWLVGSGHMVPSHIREGPGSQVLGQV